MIKKPKRKYLNTFCKSSTKKKKRKSTSTTQPTKRKTNSQKKQYIQIANFYNSLQYPEKYVGKEKVISLRSSYEIKYAIKIDNDPTILEWSSEDIIIKYFFPFDLKYNTIVNSRIQYRKYYTDFYLKRKEDDGSIKEYIIEVKPYKDTIPPIQKKYSTQSSYTYAIFMYKKNLAKWKATEEFCKNERKKGRKIYFRKVTEKNLI